MSTMNRWPKQYIIIRADLEISYGKMMSQVAHAVNRLDENMTADYYEEFKPVVIVCWVNDELELHRINQLAINEGLPTAMQIDTGKNEVEPNTPTVLVVGPCYDINHKPIDRVCGKLPTVKDNKGFDKC